MAAAPARRGGGSRARAPHRVRPLLALLPYVLRYRGRVLGGARRAACRRAATLAVPLAVRRMIDFGFSAERIALIDSISP